METGWLCEGTEENSPVRREAWTARWLRSMAFDGGKGFVRPWAYLGLSPNNHLFHFSPDFPSPYGKPNGKGMRIVVWRNFCKWAWTVCKAHGR